MKMLSLSTKHDGRVRMENTNASYKHSSPQNVSSETVSSFLVSSWCLWSYPLKVTPHNTENVLPVRCGKHPTCSSWRQITYVYVYLYVNVFICIYHIFIIKIVFESKGFVNYLNMSPRLILSDSGNAGFSKFSWLIWRTQGQNRILFSLCNDPDNTSQLNAVIFQELNTQTCVSTKKQILKTQVITIPHTHSCWLWGYHDE